MLKLTYKIICLFIFTINTAFAYNYDEALQDYASAFTALTTPATLYHYQNNPRTGYTSGLHFPSTWQTIPSGQDLRLKLLVPPGVDYGTIYIQADSMDAYIGTCDGTPATCTSLSITNASPQFWPRSNSGGTYAANTTPQIVSLVVKAVSPFTFSSLAITWHVSDASLYSAWRNARNWAGGTGDCDGLGGTYCTGTTTTVPTTVTLTPSTLTSGSAQTSLISTSPAGATCSSSSSIVSIANNVITLLTAVSTDTSIIIYCGSGQATLTIKSSASESIVKAARETTDSAGNLILSIDIAPPTDALGKSVTTWVAAKIPANQFFYSTDVWFFNHNQTWTNAIDLNVSNQSFSTVQFPATGNYTFTIPIGFKKSDISPLNPEVHIAYMLSGQIRLVGKAWGVSP